MEKNVQKREVRIQQKARKRSCTKIGNICTQERDEILAAAVERASETLKSVSVEAEESDERVEGEEEV